MLAEQEILEALKPVLKRASMYGLSNETSEDELWEIVKFSYEGLIAEKAYNEFNIERPDQDFNHLYPVPGFFPEEARKWVFTKSLEVEKEMRPKSFWKDAFSGVINEQKSE